MHEIASKCSATFVAEHLLAISSSLLNGIIGVKIYFKTLAISALLFLLILQTCSQVVSTSPEVYRNNGYTYTVTV